MAIVDMGVKFSQLFVIIPLVSMIGYGFMYTVVNWINSVIGFAFGVFVIVNSYHLKINVYELVMQWISNL